MQAEIKEISIGLESIKYAMEELSRLTRIYTIASESELSPHSKKIIAIAIDSNENEISLEGFSDKIYELFKKIIKAFQWLWDKLTYIFRGNSTKAEKNLKDIRASKKIVENIVDSASNNSKFDTVTYIEQANLRTAFSYINESIIDYSVIMAKLKYELYHLELLTTLSKNYEQVAIFIDQEVYNIRDNVLEDDDTMFYRKRVETSLNGFINTYIKNSFPPIDSMYMQKIHGINPEGSEINRRESRALDSLLMNDVGYFVAVDISTGIEDFYLTTIKDDRVKTHNNKIVYFTADQISDLRNYLENISNKYFEFVNSMEVSSKVIKTKSNDILNSLQSRISEIKGSNFHPEIQNGFIYTVKANLELARYLLTLAENATKNIADMGLIISRDIDIYINLYNANIDYYKQ